MFFVIDEKNNQIELTDKGIEHLSDDKNTADFFVLPDLGAEIAKIDGKRAWTPLKSKLMKKRKLFSDFSVKEVNAYTP